MLAPPPAAPTFVKALLSPSFARFAALDVLRFKREASLQASALFMLTLLLAVPMLLEPALEASVARVLLQAPSLTVRRLSEGAFAPIPIGLEATLRSVPGITGVWPRAFGPVRTPSGNVTVVGVYETPEKKRWPDLPFLQGLEEGEAVVGPGVIPDADGTLTLLGSSPLSVKVRTRLGPEDALAAHDLVFLPESQAASLLGLTEGTATDLALSVFRQEEAEVLAEELERTAPFPIRVQTRERTRGVYLEAFQRRSGLATLVMIPALVGLLLLVLSSSQAGQQGRLERGLLRSLGWTSTELIAVASLRCIFVGGAGITTGLFASVGLVFIPGQTWVASMLLGWQPMPPSWILEPKGALLPLLTVGPLLWLPYLGASLFPLLREPDLDPVLEARP